MKIAFQLYHGGPFEGPECQKILKNISSLQLFAEKHTFFEAEEIVDCLKKFNSVFEWCFGNELGQNYQQKILEFQNSFLATEANISPKVQTFFTMFITL